MLSSVGHIAVPRRYYVCRHCKARQTPWEAWAGISGPHRVTPHARRMIVLGGSGCSFDEAARNLKELCHLRVSNDLVRRVCHEEGKSVQQWLTASPAPHKAFAAAKGVIEFSTDGLKVNTVDGWRETALPPHRERHDDLPAPFGQFDRFPVTTGDAVRPCGVLAPDGYALRFIYQYQVAGQGDSLASCLDVHVPRQVWAGRADGPVCRDPAPHRSGLSAAPELP